MPKRYLLLFLSVLSTTIYAQNLSFQKYGVSEGLSSNTVFSTIEDEAGFIWISTEEGVDRFDGLNFKHYSLPNLYEYRTANDVEYYLKIDSKNKIWLFTLGGLLYNYDTWKDEFVLYCNLKDETDQTVYTFYIDHTDKLWFGTQEGVLVLDPMTKLFLKIQGAEYFTSSIIQDNDHRYYLGTDIGVLVLDSDRNFLYNLLNVSSTKNTGLESSRIRSFFIDEANDKLWIGSDKLGLCGFNLINFDFLRPEDPFKIKGLKINSFERFSASELMIGVDGKGIIIWDLNNQKFKQVISDEENVPASLSSRSVQQVFCNSAGVFFISTWRGGLNVFSPGKLNFQSIKHYAYVKNSIRNNVVKNLIEISPGVIAFLTDKGLSIWDRQKDIWQHVDIKHKEAWHMSNSKSITVDSENNLWATSYTDSLVLFKKKGNGEYFNTKDFHTDLMTLILIEVYADENLSFAWAGGLKEGVAYYYSIHGPMLLIELDNSQNNANHVHTAVRDLTNDYAEDLLLEHYQKEHH